MLDRMRDRSRCFGVLNPVLKDQSLNSGSGAVGSGVSTRFPLKG